MEGLYKHAEKNACRSLFIEKIMTGVSGDFR